MKLIELSEVEILIMKSIWKLGDGITVYEIIDYLVASQSVMLATNQLMMEIGAVFIVAAAVIWLAPKPLRVVEPGAGGH